MGILHGKILEWAASSSFRGIFPIRGSNPRLLPHLLWQEDSLPLGPPGRTLFQWILALLPNHLPKAPPLKASILRIKFQQMNLVGGGGMGAHKHPDIQSIAAGDCPHLSSLDSWKLHPGTCFHDCQISYREAGESCNALQCFYPEYIYLTHGRCWPKKASWPRLA